MLTIETKELNISEKLKKKVEMICKFAYAKPTYKNGNIRNIKGTNIADGTSREDEINDYIYEQNYGIDKDYNDRDIDI